MIFQKLISMHVEAIFRGCTSHMFESEHALGTDHGTSDCKDFSFEDKMRRLQVKHGKKVNTVHNGICVAQFILYFLTLW